MNPKLFQTWISQWMIKKSMGCGLLGFIVLAGGGMWFFYSSENKKPCVEDIDASRKVSEECSGKKSTKHEKTPPSHSPVQWRLSLAPPTGKVLLTTPLASPVYFGLMCKSQSKHSKATLFIEFSPERVAAFKEDFDTSEVDALLYRLLSLKVTHTYFIKHSPNDDDTPAIEKRMRAVQNLHTYLERDGLGSLYKALEATSEEAHINMANDEYGFKKPLSWKKESDHVFVMDTAAQLNKAELSFLLGGISVSPDFLEIVFEDYQNPTCLIPGFSLPKGLSAKNTNPDESCLKVILPTQQAQKTIQTLRSQCGF